MSLAGSPIVNDDVESTTTWVEVEDVLVTIKEDCKFEMVAAQRTCIWLKQLNKGLGIPSLIIAYVNSVLIAGIMSDIMGDQALSLTTCSLAMASGILQSVMTFLKIPERLEVSTKLYMELQSLMCNIEVMLAMPSRLRQIDAGKYVADCAEKHQHLLTMVEIPVYSPGNTSPTQKDHLTSLNDDL